VSNGIAKKQLPTIFTPWQMDDIVVAIKNIHRVPKFKHTPLQKDNIYQYYRMLEETKKSINHAKQEIRPSKRIVIKVQTAIKK